MGIDSLRVLSDPPLEGAVNMARDEALLVCVGAGASPPTIRFYQWSPPTISLGYFQHYAEYEALPPPAGELAVVRRPTGGGAILHDRELTYSITLPIRHHLLERGPLKLYELAHDALIEVLCSANVHVARDGETDGSGAARGPFFCFSRRHQLDVLCGTEKLAGSAQRRTREAVLQHGSIVLERRFEQQRAAAIGELTALSADELARRMARAIEMLAGIALVEGTWSEEELREARWLQDKYASDAWTQRR
jgi:lipoate-protein ligase A